MTTMLLSTSIPTPKARPDREMMFKVMSVKYISTMANSTLMGMEKAIITVGLTSRRNRASTRIARIPPRIRFCSTDWMIILM